jgi:hypothetical protein
MDEATASPTNRQIFKVALAGIVGSTIEQYDFLVTGVIAATVWGDTCDQRLARLDDYDGETRKAVPFAGAASWIAQTVLARPFCLLEGLYPAFSPEALAYLGDTCFASVECVLARMN